MSRRLESSRLTQVIADPISLGHDMESVIIMVPYNKHWWKAQQYRGLHFKIIVRSCRRCFAEGGKSSPALQSICPRL